MSNMITVYIDQDPSSLGPDATREDIDCYAENLAAHLSERFGIPIEVEPTLGGERAGFKCLARDDINEYMRELEAGDGWLALLPEP